MQAIHRKEENGIDLRQDSWGKAVPVDRGNTHSPISLGPEETAPRSSGPFLLRREASLTATNLRLGANLWYTPRRIWLRRPDTLCRFGSP
jgi:hypothetical protein